MATINLIEVAETKYGSQAKCAAAMHWSRQRLNKILLKQREARVTEINALSLALGVTVAEVVNFLS